MRVADVIVSRLAAAGARAIFGMPGGGTNLDIIDAAPRAALPFVLAHTETGGAIMAAAQAEITGGPGVCLSTLGPGVSSLVNGVAHAFLDRVPLVVFTDAMPEEGRRRFAHQNLPHAALLGPITRFSTTLTAGAADALMREALACAFGPPPGPVHIDCVPAAINADADAPVARTAPHAHPRPAALSARAEALLQEAQRPLAIVGLGARDPAAAAAVRGFCERRGVPALVTYKAKGVIESGHPWYAGLFTLGEIERPLVEAADVLITIGLDPVELLPRAWPWAHPIVHCSGWPASHEHLPGDETFVGDIPGLLENVEGCLRDTARWSHDVVARHRDRQRAAVMLDTPGLSPGRALAAVATASRAARHVAVDAGAHMLPAMALLPADAPNRILISNGLSTMGYALPAAIGAALLAPSDAVLAITGDAGLLMCLGELRTAAREGLRIVVIVLADGELSLIRIKQDRRGLTADGVRIGEMDWRRAGEALGLRAASVADERGLRDELAAALDAGGPSLIEIRIDPSAYGPMLRALRG